jgi:hypothetical protein
MIGWPRDWDERYKEYIQNFGRKIYWKLFTWKNEKEVGGRTIVGRRETLCRRRWM